MPGLRSRKMSFEIVQIEHRFPIQNGVFPGP